MNRVKLDDQAAAVKKFVRSLPLEPEGVELELNGRVMCRVVSPNLLSDKEKKALFGRVADQLKRSHDRNRRVPTRTIEREVSKAVKQVRSRRRS